METQHSEQNVMGDVGIASASIRHAIDGIDALIYADTLNGRKRTSRKSGDYSLMNNARDDLQRASEYISKARVQLMSTSQQTKANHQGWWSSFVKNIHGWG